MTGSQQIGPRSKARRACRELTFRVLYAMDMSGLSAHTIWQRNREAFLYQSGLPIPSEPISVSIQEELPRIMSRKAPEPADDAQGWAQAMEVSKQVEAQNPQRRSKKRSDVGTQAATLARHWSEACEEQAVQIDEVIGSASKRWKVRRMAIIDRNILRIGAFELLTGVTPPKDVIYDCVELAKRYGEKRTPGFVNGILDQICQNQGISL